MRHGLRARQRGGRPPLVVRGKAVLLVDVGVATGATMRAAVKWARAQEAARVVVAVPVASREAVTVLGDEADEVVCLATPPHFRAVGLWYEDFRQVDDQDVVAILEGAWNQPSAHP